MQIQFCKDVEAQFKMYSKSRMSDYSDMSNLNIIESDAYKNSKIGGDVLVILRYVDGCVKVELIDGEHVQSPAYGGELFPMELQNGNKIINGIEINAKRQHVAYYVRKDYMTLEYERVPARGTDTDALMSFMVYGSKYRLDNYRGLPLLSVMFETAKKLERYKEATVASAEERAKIVMAIEHDIFSTGENPLLKQTVLARELDLTMSPNLVPRDDFGKELANNIAITTDKSVYNLPLGAHLKALESKSELAFKEFYETNIMLFCAATGIPYEVAMSKYDSNYSASRGAIKDWEHKINVQRNHFSFQFMQPIYDFWLEVRILQKKVKADGYLKALISNDRMVKEAYRNARFVGAPVPHIDPVKEVEAERLKLGMAGAAMPLTTLEQATENLGGGDAIANIEQFAEELKLANSLGAKMPEVAAQNGKPTGKPAKPAKAKNQ
jgi:capsid protein